MFGKLTSTVLLAAAAKSEAVAGKAQAVAQKASIAALGQRDLAARLEAQECAIRLERNAFVACAHTKEAAQNLSVMSNAYTHAEVLLKAAAKSFERAKLRHLAADRKSDDAKAKAEAAWAKVPKTKDGKLE